jgi:hypothetical protein
VESSIEVLLHLLLLAELNNIIRNKDDEITDLKNLMYRCSDDAEKLIQALERCRCTTRGVYDTDQGDDR